MWEIEIENVAGIRSGTATIEAGVNAIQASNWQGKTSLLAAIETVMGTGTRLTEGADHGRVNLETPEGKFETELGRSGEEVVRSGDPYLTDAQDLACAELFAFLGESNPVRQSVRAGGDLEALLTRPLDLENIDEQIADLADERRQLETELDAAEEAAGDLAARQEVVTDLETELEGLRARHEEVAAETADDDGTERRDELSDKRAARDRTRQQIRDLERQIEELEDRLEDRTGELDAVEVPDGPDIRQRLAEKHDELQAVETKIELLQAVYNANKRVIDEGEVALLADIERGIVEDEFTCWVCGEPTGRGAVDGRLEALGEEIASLREQATDRGEEIETLESRQRQIDERRRQKADLEDRIDDLESRLADRRTALDDAHDRLADLEATVESLGTAVATTDERLTDLESEIKYKEAELADVRADLEQTAQLAERRDSLEAQLDDVTDEIEALRTRKERVKESLHRAFDDAMEDVLAAFEPGFEWAWLDEFELRIARDGRSADIGALSEGEVELLGIMVGLAGYEAFDVEDRLPVILLDGLGGLAGEHLHRLVEYVEGRAEYLVTTAYPEVGDFEGNTISPEDWSVVSNDAEAVV